MGGGPLSAAFTGICPSRCASAVAESRCHERAKPLVTDRVARSNHLGVEHRSRSPAFRSFGSLGLGYRPPLCPNSAHPPASTQTSAAQATLDLPFRHVYAGVRVRERSG